MTLQGEGSLGGEMSVEKVYVLPEKRFLRKKEIVEDLIKLKDVADERKGIRRVASWM
jgi:hypothetical protein